MKKIFAICGAALMTLACAKDMPQGTDAPAVSDGLRFMATVEPVSKVLTSQGKSTWEVGDEISIFSVADDAEPGVALGVNVPYRAASAGTTTEFVQVDELVGRSDRYYAYFPACPKHPNTLNENTDIDFAGVAKNAEVDDYRFMPVWINTGVTITYDPATGNSSSSERPFFYASGVAPAEEDQPVELLFKPILPVIEFGLKGAGTVTSMVIEYADKSTDVLDNSTNKWLTGKGVFNISSGVLTTTNTSPSGYCKLTVTLKSTDEEYIQLDNATPVYFQISVGRFEITKGLKLTFTDKDGNEFEKTIWTDKTYKGMSDTDNPKFISQVVNVPHKEVEGGDEDADVEYDPESYYELDMTTIDWTQSYVHNVTAGGNTMAVITKEFFGADVNKQGVVVYPASSNVADYTDGTVLEVTLDGDAAPTGNVHGGTLNAWTTVASKVDYTEGTSAPIAKIYVKGDGTEILFDAPETEVLKAKRVPYTLTSTSGQVHPLVKIGNRFWTACGYKTTKQIDGTDINQNDASAGVTANATRMVISDDKWLYNGIAIGFTNEDAPKFTNKIAPTGWTLPSVADWSTDLANFFGSSTYSNMTKSLLFSRTTYNIKKVNNVYVVSDLGYYNTWTSESHGSGNKSYMVLSKANGDHKSSAQGVSAMFELRLVSVKPE